MSIKKLENSKPSFIPDMKSDSIYIKNYEYKNILHVAKALASSVRLQILELLEQHEANIGKIAQDLTLTQSNATQQVAILEAAGLVSCRWEKGNSKGKQKICHLNARNVLLNIVPFSQGNSAASFEESMPIGLYINIKIDGPCGLVSEHGLIGNFDDPTIFLNSARSQAQLLWFTKGWVEYMFPLPVKLPNQEEYNRTKSLFKEEIAKIKAIEFRTELCSEFPGYNEHWPSDLTLWLNGVELGTWTSPGDMGKRRGIVTPSWWSDFNTQHGFLTTWRIDSTGCSINGEPVQSEGRLDDIDFNLRAGMVARLGIKEDSPNQGGLNLFGCQFGNYAQDLVLQFYY